MTDTTPPKALNPQQEQFSREYLIDLNATQAAIRAGYAAATANRTGPRLLSHVGVSQRIAELMAQREARTQITADRVLEELAAIGFTRFTDLATWGTDTLEFTASDDLGEMAKRSVKSVKVKRTTISSRDGSEQTSVEMELTQHDKLSALDKLAKHLNLYGEQEKAGKSGLDALVEHMEKRRQERAAERAMAKDTPETESNG